MENRMRTKAFQEGAYVVYEFQSSNDMSSRTFSFIRLATFGEDQDPFFRLGFRLSRPSQTTLGYGCSLRHSGLDHEFQGCIGASDFYRLRGT